MILSGGRELATVEATQPISALVIAGRHETGQCGFVIDETVVPGIRGLAELEIREAETGMLIYRRSSDPSFVQEKLVRLETHMVGLRRVDRAIGQRFCYAYVDAERRGLESVTQIFHLLGVRSLYLAGRFFYRSFESLVEQQCKMICMIHDPFEELAERLLLFRYVARRGRRLDVRDALTFDAAVEFAANFPFEDSRKLRSAFSRISTDAARAFQNPLVRQLTVANPQDMPRSGSLAAALNVLASCAIVGLRSEAASFALAVSAFLGSDDEIVPVAPRCIAAVKLADQLRDQKTAQSLLELDLELYEGVVGAYRKAAAGLLFPSPSGYLSAP